MSSQGQGSAQKRGKGNKTPQKTPTKGTRQSPRNKKQDQPVAMDTVSELSNSTGESMPTMETEKKAKILPDFYEKLELSKTLYDLAVSIQKSPKGNVLGNKDVKKNFEDAQQIFEGWRITPVTTPTKGQDPKGKGNKRKRSDVPNGDESTKIAEYTDLQESAKKLKEENEELNKQLEEKNTLVKENKVKDDIIKQLKNDNKKLEQDLNNEKKLHQETIIAKEEHKKVEVQKQSKEFSHEIDTLQNKLTEANLEITKLKETIKEKEKNLLNEQNDHKKTKTEEKREKEELQKLKEDLLYGKDTLQNELTKAKVEIQQKNEELESISNDLIKSSDFNQQKNKEYEALRNQFTQMQSDMDQKNEELNDLRNRLSSLSASKLDGDPNITDLGDPNRPLKLVDRYQQLYDNLWTDAFDELTDSYTDVDDSSEKEKMAATEIMSIFEKVLQFCKHLTEDQEKTIVSTLMCCSPDSLDQNAVSIDISTIRNMRKSNALQTLPSLVQLYTKQNEQDLTGLIKDFTEECLAVCWLTQVQDPPMAFEFDYAHGVPLDKDLMREFTVSGDVVDYVVWPTMRINQDGPVMVKSVVQPIKKRR